MTFPSPPHVWLPLPFSTSCCRGVVVRTDRLPRDDDARTCPLPSDSTTTGNTETVAGYIGEATGLEGVDIGDAEELESYDGMIIGAPTWHTVSCVACDCSVFARVCSPEWVECAAAVCVRPCQCDK